MPILLVGGDHDGERVESIPEGYVPHEIVITNHDDRREAFPVYTPDSLSLADIFRLLLRGYRVSTHKENL
jgi:hypothetical protein